MANRIKGITVEIGGDTTKLSKAKENDEYDGWSEVAGQADFDAF